jgi:hypothetical protein
MLDLPAGFLVPEERAANRSLTIAEAELVRLLNEEFSRRAWPDRNYARFMRYGAVEHMKNTRQPSPDEPRIATPSWALARAAEISAEMAKNIEALGVNIVGDISTLGEFPGDGPDPGPEASSEPPVVSVEVAARAAVGAFLAGGASGRTAEETVRELDARSLAKVLARRCRQRVRRTLPG